MIFFISLPQGTLRGHLEEEAKDNFAQHMSVAASKESARHLLRKWLLRPEDKKTEEVTKEEVCYIFEIIYTGSLVIHPHMLCSIQLQVHKEVPKVIVAQPEESKTLAKEVRDKTHLSRFDRRTMFLTPLWVLSILNPRRISCLPEARVYVFN
jgi:hypothetical protein